MPNDAWLVRSCTPEDVRYRSIRVQPLGMQEREKRLDEANHLSCRSNVEEKRRILVVLLGW